jgi:ferrous iron transport protein A
MQPLTSLPINEQSRIARIDADEAIKKYLADQGVILGSLVKLLAVSQDNALLQIGEKTLSLAIQISDAIQVERQPESSRGTATNTEDTQQRETPPIDISTNKEQKEMKVNQISLNQLHTGQRGIVVHVGGKGPSRRRMMDMGLVPGTEVKVVRVAPLGDPIEFTVKGYSLSLRKSEAKDIQVEISD